MTMPISIKSLSRQTVGATERRLVLESLEPRMLMTASKGSISFDESLTVPGHASGAIETSSNDQFVGPILDQASGSGANGLKRYAILGDDVAAAETALTEMGRAKIKSFQHLGGLAVHLSDAEAESLRSRLGSKVRVMIDEPVLFLASGDPQPSKSDASVAAKPGGGGGGPGGGEQVPWGITSVKAPLVWSDSDPRSQGAGVAVCVVDSGLDMDHPDLAANIAAGANYITGGSWDDDAGHGTHVGGTIAALDNSIGVVGVAPKATLLAAKAFDRRGAATSTDVADAIYGCRDLRNSLDADMPLVVNMSFTSGGTDGAQLELIHIAIHELAAQGVVFVGAVGNSYGIGEATPARWPEVLMVTGVDQNLKLAPFSGWNNQETVAYLGDDAHLEYRDPDFTAPATSILSLWRGGGTKSLEGTSMAAAHVSGVVALGLATGTLQPLDRDPELFAYRTRTSNVGYDYEYISLQTPLGTKLPWDPLLSDAQQGRGLIDAVLTVNAELAQASQATTAAALQSGDVSTGGQSVFVGLASDGVASDGLVEALPPLVPVAPAPGLVPASRPTSAVDRAMAEFGQPSFIRSRQRLSLGLQDSLGALLFAN